MAVFKFGLAAVIVAFSTLPSFSQDLKISIRAAGYSEADVRAALTVFRNACRPLGTEFWDDVEEVTVNIQKEVADHRLARGWDPSFQLALKYAENPKRGPSFASGTGVLAGHTLHYSLGGGRTPGYLASKRSSQYLCGLAISPNGEDVFQSVQALDILAN